MHLISTELLLASAVFARSIKVLGWQPWAPKFRCLQGQLKCLDEHDFPKKKRPIFFEVIEPVTPLWVLYPSEIMPVGTWEPPLAIAVFARSIKMLGWQPGAPKSREHDFPKKNIMIY